MAPETDRVEVVCLHCGTVSTAYLHRSGDVHPEEWHPEDGVAAPDVCPECGTPFTDESEPEFDVLGRHPAA